MDFTAYEDINDNPPLTSLMRLFTPSPEHASGSSQNPITIKEEIRHVKEEVPEVSEFDVLSNSDTARSSGPKRTAQAEPETAPAKRPKVNAYNPKKGSKTNDDATYDQLTTDHQRISIVTENKEVKTVPLLCLRISQAIRPLNNNYVQKIIQQMKAGEWRHDEVIFIVVKAPNSDEFYDIVDGNHRYAAYMKFNTTQPPKFRFIDAMCSVYDSLSVDKLIHITTPTINSTFKLPYSLFRQATLARRYVKSNSLNIPENRANMRKFSNFMKTIMGPGCSAVVPLLCQISEEDWIKINNMFEFCDDNPLDSSNTDSAFWHVFIKAWHNNSDEAVEKIQSLSYMEASEVKKDLAAIPPKLLEILASRLPHNYKTHEEAINDLTDNSGMSAEAFLTMLIRINFFAGKPAVSWDVYKHRIRNRLSKTNGAVKYAADKAVDSYFEGASYIVTEDPSPSLIESFEGVCHEAFIVIIVNDPNAAPPNIGKKGPSASIQILLTTNLLPIPPNCKKIPVVTANAYLFHPVAVNERDIVQLARRTGCKLATCIQLENVPELAKLAPNFDRALLMKVSRNLADAVLKPCPFTEVVLCYNEELKSIVDEAYKKRHEKA
uniref:ParB domain-containing protein n=1 Tax=Panagrellus redivivus TaxID=6233 RepID=A0A7E4WBC9_PANRE